MDVVAGRRGVMKPPPFWRLWYLRRLDRRNCFHHHYRVMGGGESWIKAEIIDSRKLYTCRNCRRRWII
jgi:hypothetical protein